MPQVLGRQDPWGKACCTACAWTAVRRPGPLVFAGNLAFPLLLVAGLFLLSRQSQGGMGGPGNPNNPLSFGKSRARFQMEANTGVTFSDVAGVDEAKQDFMEVSAASSPRRKCAELARRAWVSGARRFGLRALGPRRAVCRSWLLSPRSCFRKQAR